MPFIIGSGIVRAGAAAGATTVYGPLTLATTDAGWQGLTFVQLLNASNLLNASGTQVKLIVNFQALSAGNGANVYIGQQAAVGDAYDFANTPAHVLFSGADIVGDGSTLTYTSDWINLPEAYDETKNYLVSAEFPGGGTTNLLRTANTGDQNWFKSGADATTVDKTGYTAYLTNTAEFVSKVEIQ